ncbi:MAG: hypothetical protein AAFV45_04235 [Pseudomonadota bacterium]
MPQADDAEKRRRVRSIGNPRFHSFKPGQRRLIIPAALGEQRLRADAALGERFGALQLLPGLANSRFSLLELGGFLGTGHNREHLALFDTLTVPEFEPSDNSGHLCGDGDLLVCA